MKELVSYIIFIALSGSLFSQQEYQSSQFMINPFLINPAYSTSEDYVDLKASYRNQWQGVENAPQTTYISLHTPVGKPRWSRTHPGDFHNWHGTGMIFMKDDIGPYTFTRVQANYSYNIGLSAGKKYGYYHVDGLRVAIGTFLTYQNNQLNKKELTQSVSSSGGTVYNPLAGEDETLAGLPANQSNFNMAFGGLLYYLEKYYLGVTVTQLFGVEDDFNYTYAKHYYLTGTYKANLGQRSYLIPSVIAKKVFGTPWSYELNTRYDLDDTYFIGGTYRSQDAMAAMIGYRFNPDRKVLKFRERVSSFSFEVYYTYDFTINALRKKGLENRSNGSHEITLGILMAPKYKERNAEDTW